MSLAQSPPVLRNLIQTEPEKTAVGVRAVASSFKHVFSAMPVGRGTRLLLDLNQEGGIDCPSCAWPDPDVEDRSPIAEYCENGAKAIAEEATTRKVGSVLFQKYSVKEMAEKTDYWMSQQGRLTHPMVLREGATHYEKISWEDAFQLIADELNALASPNEAIFYTSGRSSNEAAYLYQLFARQFGTNNMPDCSNMCHESSGVALGKTLGIGKGSATLHDLEQAELVIVMGQNPGTNSPRMLSALEKAKRSGGKIVSVNPLIETGLRDFKNPQTIHGVLGGGTDLADMFMQIRINGDLALIKILIKLLWEAEQVNPGSVFDFDFIEAKTQGYEDFMAYVDKFDTAELLADTGLAMDDIRQLAQWIMERKRLVICWAMGLTQHQNSVPTLQEIVNLLLLRGSIGISGAGTFPVRGHSNVQGDRTMGIFHKLTDDLAAKLKDYFGFDPPREMGYDVVESIKAMHEGKAKVFMGLGGNFVSAAPDTEYTAEALQQCNLTIQVSTKLNRTHFIHGKQALILPCLGRTDRDIQADHPQFLTTESSTGVVQRTEGILEPPSRDLMSEPAIIAHIADKTIGSSSKIDWLALKEYDIIREFIANTVKGCEDMNEKVRQENGFELPNGPRHGDFTTDTGKAKFTANDWKPAILQEDELMMMTIRSHDQFNTTIYGFNDRYRGIFNERRVIFMNETDMKKRGLAKHEIVNISSNYDGKKRTIETFKVVPYNIPLGCVGVYFPEANPLVPIQCVAEGSNTPTSKSIIVKVEKP